MGRVMKAETRDFSAFLRPVGAIPDRVEAAIARGVQTGVDYAFVDAGRLLSPEGDGLVDAVIRNRDGVLVVACRTDMPGVTPEMWEWWFAWHSYAAERYRLWHPDDHVSAAASEDHSRQQGRDRYIGLTSYVDERIGPGEVHKLAVTFRAPGEFGLDERALAAQGTAICARGALADKFVDVSYLVHFVRRTPSGAEMLSRFWLGHVESKLPLVGGLISRRMNTREQRLKVTPDVFGLQLLRHCAQEMNHLASILPALHAAYGRE